MKRGLVYCRILSCFIYFDYLPIHFFFCSINRAVARVSQWSAFFACCIHVLQLGVFCFHGQLDRFFFSFFFMTGSMVDSFWETWIWLSDLQLDRSSVTTSSLYLPSQSRIIWHNFGMSLWTKVYVQIVSSGWIGLRECDLNGVVRGSDMIAKQSYVRKKLRVHSLSKVSWGYQVVRAAPRCLYETDFWTPFFRFTSSWRLVDLRNL